MKRHHERFVKLTTEIFKHTSGGDFSTRMQTFPSKKFHEWCDVARKVCEEFDDREKDSGVGWESHGEKHALIHEIRAIRKALECICETLRSHVKQVLGFGLSQIQGDFSMSLTAITPGTTKNLQISLLPPDNNVPLQSGPTVTGSDPSLVLGAVGPDLKFTADLPVGTTLTSVDIAVAGVNGNGDSISNTFTIPVTQAPPPPVQVSGFDLNNAS